jgi:PAS domain S-box-containing protein
LKAVLQSTFVRSRHISSRAEFELPAQVLIFAGLAVAYFLSGKLSLEFALIHPSASGIWAPSGISLAACILFGYRIWPAISIGAFLVNATTYGSIATSAGIAIGNTAEAVVGAYLVRRFARGQSAFDRTADTFRFILFGAILSTMASATIGVTSLCAAGYAAPSKWIPIWFTWWLGDATGDLIVAPLLILWARNPRLDWNYRKIIEAVLLAGALLLITGVVFGGFSPFRTPQFPNAFLCIPVLLWVAFRFGPRDTATIILLLSIAAVWGTASGAGPFTQGHRNEALLLVQAFVAVAGTSHLIVAIEVSERRRLDQSRARLGAVVESSDDAIIAITPEGRITDWNASAERLYGFSTAEALGNPISMIIPPDRRSESAEVLDRIRKGGTVPPFETVRLRKDGTRTDVSLAVSPVRDGEGRIIGASKIARDITKLKQARSEREALLRSERGAREAAEIASRAADAANRAKDEFLAMLAHELRNPLHAILLAVQLLEKPSNVEKGHGIIARQAQHMARLVDDLLDAARVTSGRIALVRRPLNLTELVVQCIEGLRETGQLERYSVEKDCETAVWVNGDSDRLSQLVTNLLSNAVKYTPAEGKICVRVKAGEQAAIEVHDNGIGISQDILPYVFDLFTRGKFGLERSPAGLGIGLTLVKRIAELHGGRAEASSEGPARGSTFTVTLPCIPDPQAQGHNTNGEPGKIAPRRILLIEDNADARECLRMLLQASGHEVYEAIDGPAGVAKAFAVKPDVVLIDLGLPGLDGYEVARRIRSAYRSACVNLIAVTGYDQEEYRARAETAGFDSYLVKPVDAGTLERLIGAQPHQSARYT